jgi:hypothetical protein
VIVVFRKTMGNGRKNRLLAKKNRVKGLEIIENWLEKNLSKHLFRPKFF